MRATFTDEQEQLRDVARGIAEAARPSAPRPHARVGEATSATRALMDGFAGLAVPADVGGMGGELVDLVVVAHELGRHVVPTPYLPHAMAVQVALAAGLDVAGAAAGDERWTLATEEPGAAALGPWTASADPPTGTKVRVPHAADADRIVATCGDDAVVLTSGTCEDPGALDLGRPAQRVELGGERVAGADHGARSGLLRALPVLSGELVGVGRGAVHTAADHARQREQFGQPIGRFQGVSFQLADALVAVEEAWSLVLYAAWAIDADAGEATRAVHLAKARAGEAAVLAAENCTQVHGGIGITWEAMPHLYLRRAVAGAAWLGDADWHRARVGRELLDA